MLSKEKQNQTNFEDYKQKSVYKKGISTESDSREKETHDLFSNFSLHFLKLSIVSNLLYFLYQILFFGMENAKSAAFYLSLGLFCTYVALMSIRFVLYTGKSFTVDINMLTCFSYFTINIHIVLITFLSFFLKESIHDNRGRIVNRFPYDFCLVLSGFLMLLPFEFKTLLRHSYLIIFYFISTIGIISLNGFINGEFQSFIISVIISVLLFSVLIYVKKTENVISSKSKENYNLAENTYGHLQFVTKVLNAGIFLFKNRELFFSNEIGKNILDCASIIPLNKIKDESEMNLRLETQELKKLMEDSAGKLDNLKETNQLANRSHNGLNAQTAIQAMFSNLHIHEDTSNLQEIFSMCKTDCSYHNSSLKNALILEENIGESRQNLYTIFQLLISSCALSNPESNCDCVRLIHSNEYACLGIFKLLSGEGTKKFFEIFTKIENSSTGQPEIEFIFKDVTSHYDLLSKIDEINLNFKKNAHEFKTPILSLLGCAEELKSQLNIIESLLPETEKTNINIYLDHVTNLSSYIGFLIKGLTKSSKETSDKSNSIAEHKEIKLNSLLNFCLCILQSLLGCDSQKLKNVEAEL